SVNLSYVDQPVILIFSQTVEVQPGEDVTLLCSNFSSSPTQTVWFTLVNRTQPRCISSMYSSTEPASLCNGVEKGKFEMSSNISTVFLKIKRTDVSDSGLYFCGFNMNRYSVLVSATYLKVQGKIIVKSVSWFPLIHYVFL
uniref:Ig-like domain-containing protein n=1 Tax=Dicentrarchus labrax TaxID=13489 RepID=A0A8C4DW55_DICLA